MIKKSRNILSLTLSEVFDNLKPGLLYGCKFPKYFDFDKNNYPLCVIISIVDLLKNMKKRDAIKQVHAKLFSQLNSDYNQHWLQSITYIQDKRRKKLPNTMRLCQLMIGIFDEPM